MKPKTKPVALSDTEKLAVALKALRFYADRDNYGYDHDGDLEDENAPGFTDDIGFASFQYDNGAMAAVALEKIGEKIPKNNGIKQLRLSGPKDIRDRFERLP